MTLPKLFGKIRFAGSTDIRHADTIPSACIELSPDRRPKRDDQTARDNQRSAYHDRGRRHRPEDQKADDLPNDEQGGDVDAHHLVKLERSRVEGETIAEEQYRASQEVGAFHGKYIAAKPDANEGIARHFKRRSNDQQANNDQFRLERHSGLLASRFSRATLFSGPCQQAYGSRPLSHY